MAIPTQEPINTEAAAPPAGPYNQGIRWGGLLFTSSVSTRRPGEEAPAADDVRQHTANALENLKAIVEAGGSSFDHVLKVTAYLRSMRDYAVMNEVYRQYFTGILPARSLVILGDSPSPISFDAVAAVPEG